MSKWWEYEAWRRKALQIIMWGLFVVMLAMAGGLSAYRRSTGFQNAVAAGPFVVRLPSDWAIVKPTTPGALVAVANETKLREGYAEGFSQRQVFVYYKKVTPGTGPLDFLSGERSIGFSGMGEHDQSTPHEIADEAGVIVVNPRYKPTSILTGVMQAHYIGGAVLEDGSALAVRMYCKEPPNPLDMRDFQRLLDRVGRAE